MVILYMKKIIIIFKGDKDMDVIVTPSALKGELVINPSKGICHRAIIAASLSKGISVLTNVSYSEDVETTIRAMESIGARFTREKNSLVVEGSDVKRMNNIINFNDSTSSMRFIIPILLTNSTEITFNGNQSIASKSIQLYLDLFDKQGIYYRKGTDSLPLYIKGAIKPGVINSSKDTPSQLLSGLLFALPLLDGDSWIEIDPKSKNEIHLDLTISVLKKFGITIEYEEDNHAFHIPGNQTYKSTSFFVEGDFSHAAFFFCGGCINGNLVLKNLNSCSKQSEFKIVDDIKFFGGNIIWRNNDTAIVSKSDTKSTVIDFINNKDLIPPLCVLAAFSEGETVFVNASNNKTKDSDRISALAEELSKMNIDITSYPDGLRVKGKSKVRGYLTVDARSDHRLAMALTIAALNADGPVRILNADAINKSYPNFYLDIMSLGGKIAFED